MIIKELIKEFVSSSIVLSKNFMNRYVQLSEKRKYGYLVIEAREELKEHYQSMIFHFGSLFEAEYKKLDDPCKVEISNHIYSRLKMDFAYLKLAEMILLQHADWPLRAKEILTCIAELDKMDDYQDLGLYQVIDDIVDQMYDRLEIVSEEVWIRIFKKSINDDYGYETYLFYQKIYNHLMKIGSHVFSEEVQKPELKEKLKKFSWFN